MNVLFLLLSLPAAASAVQSFPGTDAAFHVTCPLKDYVASPCAPALAVPPEECSNLQACALEYTPPSDHSLVVIPLTCSCLELKDCPDTCTAGVDFVGPGTVTCDKNDFLLSPCLPVKTDDCEEDAVEAAYRSSCDTDFVPPPEDTNAVTLDIPLPCGCVKVRDCPMSCTFSETVAVVEDPEDTTEEAPGDTKETDLLNFRGPGVVVCPIMTYEANPCYPSFVIDNDRSDCDSNSCVVEPTDRSDFSQARLPLACSCIEVKQCDPSCYMEFQSVDLRSGAAGLAPSLVPATTVAALIVWMIM